MGFNYFTTLAYLTGCTGIHRHQQMDQSKTEQRPWGRFTILNEGPTFKIKQIELSPGNRISLQSHEGRDEYWTFVSGEGVLSLGTPDGNALRQIHVTCGKQVKIPKRVKHRVEALSHLVFIEVQVGRCDESDITRYADDYGRVAK